MLNNLLLGQTAEEKLYVEDVFQTYLYSGTGSSQTITTGVDLSANSGMVWIKGRSGATDHAIYDTARGVQKDLVTNSTAAQTTQSTGITAFSSTGFMIGALAKLNTSAATYASWTFRKSAKFFDCVTWTGNGANRTISHALGVVPGLIIVKRTDTTGDWQVYHRSLANTEYLVLNSTAAKATGTTRWNSTTPTATEFSLGTDATVNATGGSYVAYLFAHDTTADGVIQCGSYTTDGSGNATVNLGWEPQYVLYKPSSSTGSWWIADNMRGMTSGGGVKLLAAQNANAELSAAPSYMEPTATGFKDSATFGAVSTTVIYLAIRRGPMRTPTDATKVFSVGTRTGTGGSTSASTTTIPDAFLTKGRTTTAWWQMYDRLRGPTKSLYTNDTYIETTTTGGVTAFNQSSVAIGSDGDMNGSTVPYGDFFFRRAPGFFDVVCYTGTGSAQNILHNMGVAPELWITRRRDSNGDFGVGCSLMTSYVDKFLQLNTTIAAYTLTNYWQTPTATTFGLGTGGESNNDKNTSGGKYVAYLFASCPGVSKVFSFTGNGGSQNIDCGFTNGARFVLIKRTDSTGNWLVADTARGIVSANDPSLALNSTAAEVTTIDWIDPLSTGFTVVQETTNNANLNGATYIGLAIA